MNKSEIDLRQVVEAWKELDDLRVQLKAAQFASFPSRERLRDEIIGVRRAIREQWNAVPAESRNPTKQHICSALIDQGYSEVVALLLEWDAMEEQHLPKTTAVNTTNIFPNNSGNVINISGQQEAPVTLQTISRYGRGLEVTSHALTELKNAAQNCTEIPSSQRVQALDHIDLLHTQAQKAPAERSDGVLKATLESFPKLVSLSSSVSTLWKNHGPQIHDFFKDNIG